MSATPTGGVRLACGAAGAPAAAAVRAVRGEPDVRAGLGHRGTAGGVGVAAGRRAGGGGHRGRIAARAAHRGAVGAAAAGGADRGERAPVRRSAGAEAGRMLADLVVEGRGRWLRALPAGAEVTALRAARDLAEVDPALASRVSAYRAGFLPESGARWRPRWTPGNCSGWPRRTRWSWVSTSSAGRGAGRRVPGHACVVLATGRRAGGPGGKRCRAGGPRRPAGHLPGAPPGGSARAAGGELRAGSDDPYVLARNWPAPRRSRRSPRPRWRRVFGGARARAVLDALTADGVLRRRPAGWFWPLPSERRRPGRHRGSGAGQVVVVEADTGRMLGTSDMATAPATLHPGAVHLHRAPARGSTN